MSPRISAALLPLALGVLVVPSTGPAAAAADRCDGHRVTLRATYDVETLVGTPGRDVVDTRGFRNVAASTRGGDDVVCLRDGRADTGPGRDTIVVDGGAGSASAAFTGPGDDDVDLESGVLRLKSGHGRDRIVVHELARGSFLIGGVGYDLIDLSNLHRHGGPGVSISKPRHRVSVGPARSFFYGVESWDGTRRADVFEGGPGADEFDGYGSQGPGRDLVHGFGGDDDLGVEGSGVVYGDRGDDDLGTLGGTAYGGSGNDVLTPFADTEGGGRHAPWGMFGGDGDDTFRLISSSDECGNCYLGLGRLVLHPGAGRNRLDLSALAFWAHVDLRARRATFHDTTYRDLLTWDAPIVDVVGTRRGDRILGSPAGNRLSGAGGDDVLLAGAGRDQTDGGPGRDLCRAEIRVACER